MKLTTKIAGSMALPLALAVAANSAQAFTVVDNDEHTIAIGGYLSAITSWNIPDADGRDENNRFSAGTSRLNLSYTDKETGTKFFYEQQFVGGAGHPDGQANGLRHAYFETADGLVAGHTWSFGTNNVARIETIEVNNNSNVTDQVYSSRNLLLGQRFTVADGMKVGISLEEQNDKGGTTESVMPAVTANFDGQFGDARVFAAWTNFAAPAVTGDDERNNRLTLGASVDLGAATIRAGVTHLMLDDKVGDDKTAASVGVGFKINEQVRVNAAVEHVTWDKTKDADATSLWLNAFYLAQNGVEWGAELQYVSADDNAGGFKNVGYTAADNLKDKDMAIRLQAKYAF